jgi:tripartite ATP-independent transporter DctM subunit
VSKLSSLFVAFLTIVGMPLFAVMGAISLLSWMSHDRPELRAVRFIAPSVLEDRFVASPILVTIPLFTFAGYLMAESKTPDRLVRASSAVLGWLPGGLAIVCIVASAFFTTMTGGSGVTIVAVGGFLYPALVRQGYPKDFALGLVTSAGAIGLLFFPSPLVMIYGFVAGVDVNYAYVATFPPALGLMITLALYAVWVAKKHNVPRSEFVPSAVGGALWAVKWELAAPLVVGAGLVSGLMELDESAAAAALYMLIVEVYIYKDLTWRKVLTVAKDALSLSGALILILAMATAMTNYIIQEQIPQAILDYFVAKGMNEPWQFIVVLNLFLFVIGMLMDAFSTILVALPLLLPLAAMFNIHPFHMAVMFLLNMELAYIMPPAGLNLFISSFRFNRPVISVYRVVIPFVILLHVGLILLIVFPKFSSFTVESTIAAKKAEAEKAGVSPREAWLLECVQMDKNNPRPCTPEDKAKWGEDGMGAPEQPGSPGGEEKPVELSHEEAEKQKKDNDDLFAQMMGDTTSSTGTGTDADAGPPDSTSTGGDAASTTSGGDAPAGSASAAPADSGAPSP